MRLALVFSDANVIVSVLLMSFRQSLKNLTLPLFVGVVVAWVHGPALNSKAIIFDDNQYLLDNSLVQTPSWQSAGRFLSEVTHPSTVQGYYQPLAMISLMLDAARGGTPQNLRPFHQTSLAFHVANALLVFVLLEYLFHSAWIGALIAILWGVHPLSVEPIPWVGERKTLLATFFCLLSLIAYVRYARWTCSRPTRWIAYASTLILYVLALMSKPTSTPLPLLMLLIDYWPLGRLNIRALIEKIPLLAIGAVFAVITFVSQRDTAGVYNSAESFWFRPLLILSHNTVFYLQKMVWPTGLSPHYPFPQPLRFSNPAIWVSLMGTFILIILLLLSLKRTKAILTGWLFFFIAILPTMGLVGFTIVIASDKYAYLPSIGLLFILAWALNCVWNHAGGISTLRRSIQVLVILVLSTAILGEIAVTRHYLRFWTDSVTLYGRMLQFAPNSAAVHVNMGVAFVETGHIDEAVAHYRRALEIAPELTEATVSLASALSLQGERPEEQAMELYRQILSNTDNAEAHSNLAFLLLKRGQIQEAFDHCNRALKLKPDYADAYNNLGLIYATMGNTDTAIAQYERAISLRPEHIKARNNLGVALARAGRTRAAQECFEAAIKIQPGSAETHNNLALTLSSQGQVQETLRHLREAVRLKPDYLDAHLNLAAILRNNGQSDEAVDEYRRALQINPSDAETRISLSEVLTRLGQRELASTEIREAMRIDPQNERARSALAQLASIGTNPSR